MDVRICRVVEVEHPVVEAILVEEHIDTRMLSAMSLCDISRCGSGTPKSPRSDLGEVHPPQILWLSRLVATVVVLRSLLTISVCREAIKLCETVSGSVVFFVGMRRRRAVAMMGVGVP